MVKEIRERCLDCSGTSTRVKDCQEEDCHLYPYRFGKNPNYGNPGIVGYTPGQAVRKHCLWCSNNQPPEVRLCPAHDCPLYDYRYRGALNDHRMSEEKSETTTELA